MKLDLNFKENTQRLGVEFGQANIVHDGQNGATFIPSVSDEGVISWTNNRGLPNPNPVNIKGEKGDKGERGLQGIQGIQGERGENGKDGTSVYISHITESNEDGGSNVVTFSDGNTLTVKNGKKGSEGGGGGVSDWNDLENRPFYDNADGSVGKQLDDKYLKVLEIGEVQSDILPTTELAFSIHEDLGVYYNMFEETDHSKLLKVGEEYHVSWEGVEYVVTAKAVVMDGVEAVYIGNTIIEGGSDNGLQFAFVTYAIPSDATRVAWLVYSFTGENKTVRIYQTDEAYKIKSDYFPDSLYTQIDQRIEDYINEALGGDY